MGHSVHISEICDRSTFCSSVHSEQFFTRIAMSSEWLFQFTLAIADGTLSSSVLFFLTHSPLFICSTGMSGNYLLTNPLLRPHDTNSRYNNLLAETIVCSTPSPPAFRSPGALWGGSRSVVWECGLFHSMMNTGLQFTENL